MSFSSRGRGPSLRIASCSMGKGFQNQKHPKFTRLKEGVLKLFCTRGHLTDSVVAVQATGGEGKTQKKGKIEGETNHLVY